MKGKSMHIRDRILELRRVKAGDLAPDPRNWRAHPAAQQDALRGLLAEIGYADALLVRQLPDGRMMIIDGHLRAETTPDAMVPVLVLDVDEVEAGRILATLDPLAGLAEADTGKLAELLREVDFKNAAVAGMLANLAKDQAPADNSEDHESGEDSDERHVPELYQVVVECDGEAQQRRVYEELTAKGWKCRLLML
jgi:hypothetical protein